MAELKMNKQDEIIIKESEAQAVQDLPDVFIGATGNPGFLNMIREITQNSLDEIAKGNSIDKTVLVSYDARNHAIIVEDFGQGVPCDILAKVFSKLYSSSNYNKQKGSGRYSAGKIFPFQYSCPFTIAI